MKKFSYLWYNAPSDIRLLQIIALGLGLVMVLVSFIGSVSAVNGDFFDLPIFKMTMDEEEYEDFVHDYDEVIEDMEDLSRDEIKEFEKETGMEYDKLEKYFKKASLKNMVKIMEMIKDYDEADIQSDDVEIFKGLVTGVRIFGLVICALFFLATLFGRRGTAVLALLLSIPFHLLLTGTGYLVITVIAFLGFAVLQGRVNKAYKNYKRGR